MERELKSKWYLASSVGVWVMEMLMLSVRGFSAIKNYRINEADLTSQIYVRRSPVSVSAEYRLVPGVADQPCFFQY